MDKYREIEDRVGLLFHLQPDPKHPSWVYVAQAILCHGHCYLDSFDRDEFRQLLLNSSPENPNPTEVFPTLEQAINEIETKPDFLESRREDGGLNGATVKMYLGKFEKGMKLENCFIIDKLAGMRSKGRYYIIDGMHHLVAYGIWSKQNTDGFPIALYYCTDTALRSC